MQVEVRAEDVCLDQLHLSPVKGTLHDAALAANLRTRSAAAVLDLSQPHAQVRIYMHVVNPRNFLTARSLMLRDHCGDMLHMHAGHASRQPTCGGASGGRHAVAEQHATAADRQHI